MTTPLMTMGAARRESRYLLQQFEAWMLPRLAARLPPRVMPDHLTWLALAAAVAIGLCYALSATAPELLWAANGLWLLHWLGDSLDGTLARYRRIERPRYGYYIDHMVDMVAVGATLLGLGLSPHLALPFALLLLLGYYLLSINVFLEAQVLGRFQFGYGLIGPTELRLLAMAAGAALALGVRPRVALGGVTLVALDLVAVPLLLGMAIALAGRFARNLRHLGQLEPPGVLAGSPRPPASDSGRPR